MLHLKNKSLDDYFDYDPSTEAIRVKGHRVGVELILDAYTAGATMADQRAEFDSLTEEELHATITFYLLNKEELDQWLARVHDEQARHMTEIDAHSSPAMQRIRELARHTDESSQHAN